MQDQSFQKGRRQFMAGLAASTLTPNLLAELLKQGVDTSDPLQPYDGPTSLGVDRTSLHGKVMCGYQGWFNTPSDGANRGWVHWVKNKGDLKPGNVSVDLWPDLTEYGSDERFATGFRHRDGRIAEVFSSYRKPTVLRHFKWMKDYGIDGAFVQRFIHDMDNPIIQHHHNAVLSHAREGANRYGRTYALMYDLSGLARGDSDQLIDDFQMLVSKMNMLQDPAYLKHRGQPVVAIWGVGFKGDHRLTSRECRKIVRAFKRGPHGKVTLMLGTPTHWREYGGDAMQDRAFHSIYRQADILSPWTVGRYRTPDSAKRHARRIIAPDVEWCEKYKLDYLPVVYPGFSWSNLHGGDFNQIPRLKGEFIWSQATANRKAGAKMVYIAMFDEVDEATAIFKCTNDPPVSDKSRFLTYDGLPSDHYLRVAGRIGALYRGELAPDTQLSQAMASA